MSIKITKITKIIRKIITSTKKFISCQVVEDMWSPLFSSKPTLLTMMEVIINMIMKEELAIMIIMVIMIIIMEGSLTLGEE